MQRARRCTESYHVAHFATVVYNLLATLDACRARVREAARRAGANDGIAQRYAIIHNTTLHYTLLHNTTLHYTLLHYTILYYERALVVREALRLTGADDGVYRVAHNVRHLCGGESATGSRDRYQKWLHLRTQDAPAAWEKVDYYSLGCGTLVIQVACASHPKKPIFLPHYFASNNHDDYY